MFLKQHVHPQICKAAVQHFEAQSKLQKHETSTSVLQDYVYSRIQTVPEDPEQMFSITFKNKEEEELSLMKSRTITSNGDNQATIPGTEFIPGFTLQLFELWALTLHPVPKKVISDKLTLRFQSFALSMFSDCQKSVQPINVQRKAICSCQKRVQHMPKPKVIKLKACLWCSGYRTKIKTLRGEQFYFNTLHFYYL